MTRTHKGLNYEQIYRSPNIRQQEAEKQQGSRFLSERSPEYALGCMEDVCINEWGRKEGPGNTPLSPRRLGLHWQRKA